MVDCQHPADISVAVSLSLGDVSSSSPFLDGPPSTHFGANPPKSIGRVVPMSSRTAPMSSRTTFASFVQCSFYEALVGPQVKASRFSISSHLHFMIFGIASSSLIAIENLSDISLPFLIGFLKAAAAFACLIIYVNGLNQLFDIEINKALAVPIIVGSKPLLWGVFLFFLILSAYSVDLPLLRWKNNGAGAAFSMVSGFGIVLQLANYFHMQILSHVVLSSILWKQAKSMDLNNESALSYFYMFIWKLLYAECLLIPLVR